MKLQHIALAATAAFTLGGLATSAQALTQNEKSAILFMKQEEKLARDVYLNLHARWGLTVFANIARSEERHMDAIDSLIRRYRLKDPAPTRPGKFTYPELQQLYDQLVVQGAASTEAALQVGVAIEEADIADLRNELKIVRTATVAWVFQNLLNGSSNHLAAFEGCLADGCDGTVRATRQNRGAGNQQRKATRQGNGNRRGGNRGNRQGNGSCRR